MNAEMTLSLSRRVPDSPEHGERRTNSQRALAHLRRHTPKLRKCKGPCKIDCVLREDGPA